MQVQTVYGQSVLQRDLRWTQDENNNKGHKQLLCRILKLITESSDSEQHHNKTRRNQEARKPGGEDREARRSESTRGEDGRKPQYSSRTCHRSLWYGGIRT